MFYLSKIIWCPNSAKICLTIILSNRCELLLHACWIYLEHAKHAEAENFQRNNKPNNQRPRNLRSKEGGYAELTIIFHVIFFLFLSLGYRNVLAFPEKNGVVYRVFFSARSTWIILTFITVSLPEHWCISVVSQILFARSFHLQCVEAQGTIWCCYLFFYLVSFSLSKVNFKWASSKENAKEKYKETSIRGSHYACTLGYDSEDKENSWTSNLIKNGNNDNNAALWGIFCNK